MAIPDSTSIQIQASAETMPSKGGMTSLEAATESEAPEDTVEIEGEINYSDFYLNPDLEALLNTRGFSTQRPEILGAFEWQPTLKEDTSSSDLFGEGSGSTTYSTTPSGELFDYQCQLKQLRYLDAMGFFQKMLGYNLYERDYGYSFRATSDGESVSKRVAQKYLNTYRDNMTQAKDTLIYLSSIYEAILAFIEGQEFKNRTFDLSRDATESQDLFYATWFDKVSFPNSHATDTGSDINTLSLFPYGGTDIEFYSLMEYLGNYPSEWLYDSGNTAIVLQVFSYLWGILSFHSPEYFTSTESQSYYDDDGSVPSNGLFGYETNGDGVFDGLDYAGIFNNISGITIDISSNGYPTITTEGAGGLGHSGDTWTELIAYSEDCGDISKLLALSGQDLIQGLKLSSVDSSSSLKANTTYSHKIDQYARGTLGFKGQDDSTSIADIVADFSSDSIGRYLCPKDADETDGNSFVENFTTSNYNTSTGTSNMKSGRSYYVDEITTSEIHEAILRLDNLKNITKSLGGIVSKEIPGLIGSYSKDGNTLNSYGEYYSEDWVAGSTFVELAIRTMYIKIANDMDHLTNSDKGETYMYIPVLAAAMACEDSAFAYDLWAWTMVRDSVTYNNKQKDSSDEFSDSDYENISEYIENYLGDYFRAHIMDEYTMRGSDQEDWFTTEIGTGYSGIDPIVNQNGKTYDSTLCSDYKQDSLHILLDNEIVDTSDTAFDDYGVGDITKLEDAFDEYFLANSPIKSMSKKAGLLDLPIFICDAFEEAVANSKVASAAGVSSTNGLWDATARGLNRRSRLTLAYLWCLRAWRRYIRGGMQMFNYKTASSSGSGDASRVTLSSEIRLYFNLRSMKSLLYGLKATTSNLDWDHYSDLEEEDDFQEVTGEQWDHSGKAYYVWAQHGYRYIVEDSLEGALDLEQRALAAGSFLTMILDNLRQATKDVQETIIGNDITNETYTSTLSDITSSENYGNAALLCVTRDQLQLNWALYDSFAVPNREYPYLPASKAIMTNQSYNLAGFSMNESLIDDESLTLNSKYIFPVGLPAGMLDSLRLRMIDKTGDVSYKTSNLVKISIWRRDLKNEQELVYPKEFVFDTSSFVITGRPIDTKQAGPAIDGAQGTPPSPQTYNNAKNSVIMRRYDAVDRNTGTFKGKLWDNYWSSSEYNITSTDIYDNHVWDHFLRLYLRLTTGFDVSEDVFPFLEGNVLFDDVDPGLESLYEELSKDASEMFVDIDIESAINYDRLLGELKRSIILSSQKYRNRIIYPKVFERVFCVCINPEKWITWDPDAEEEEEAWPPLNLELSTATPDEENESYYQFYATVTILPPAETFGA